MSEDEGATAAARLDARLRAHLDRLYGAADATLARAGIRSAVEAHMRARTPGSGRAEPYDETDVVLITYPDQVREPGRTPLATLADVLAARVGTAITGLHVLPFHPATSDDGFSVVDYTAVDPALGNWSDVRRLGASYRLMADAVFNHVSASSPWFRAWKEGHPAFRDFFLVPPEGADLAQVTRPRSTPLVTGVQTANGPRRVWTTFSSDQVDLNFANPRVLVKVTETLLSYLANGVQIIRLDAVAFLWKQPGTACVHLPQTHELVRLWRTVVEYVDPGALIVTETNVPHAENISYFGDGTDEAHLVYQFPLAPLVLSAFHLADARTLSEWVASLATPSPGTTFLNFLGSHDGIGVRPVEGILTPSELAQLGALARHHGGGVSSRLEADGHLAPYELNTVYFDALTPEDTPEPLLRQVDRFIAAQSILLALAGVPAVYVQSLFGSRNWHEGVESTGRLRSINRQKFERRQLERELDDVGSRRQLVFTRLMERIRLRTARPAFHPSAPQRVLPAPAGVFALERRALDDRSVVICITNIAGVGRRIAMAELSVRGDVVDLITGAHEHVGPAGELDLPLGPYETLWLHAELGAAGSR